MLELLKRINLIRFVEKQLPALFSLLNKEQDRQLKELVEANLAKGRQEALTKEIVETYLNQSTIYVRLREDGLREKTLRQLQIIKKWQTTSLT